MLFVEGNHFCPGCEKSGDCLLQATAYALGMTGMRYDDVRRPCARWMPATPTSGWT
ncbi:MAG: hypothetical protein V9G23_02630 [Giesbergeria sp.]